MVVIREGNETRREVLAIVKRMKMVCRGEWYGIHFKVE